MIGGKYRNRKLRALFGFALLFIALGIGNILFGHHRAGIYEEMVVESMSLPMPSFEGLEGLDKSISIAAAERAQAGVRKMKSRLDFYRTVVVGGKCFLALAGFLLLIILAMLRETPGKTGTPA